MEISSFFSNPDVTSSTSPATANDEDTSGVSADTSNAGQFDQIFSDLMSGAVTDGLSGSSAASATGELADASGDQAMTALSQGLFSGLTGAIGPLLSASAEASTEAETTAQTLAGSTATESGEEALPSSPRTLFDDGNNASWSDLVDVVNPLQHLPMVDVLYQKMTGDEQGYLAQVAGGTLYGGALGAALSLAGASFDMVTGKSPLEYTSDLFAGEGSLDSIGKG